MSAVASDLEENQSGRKCLLGNWVEEVSFSKHHSPVHSDVLHMMVHLLLSSTYFLHLFCLTTPNQFLFYALQGATALLDSTRPRTCIHKHGHTGILTMDVAAKVQGTSTFRAAFNAPTSLGMRQRGRLQIIQDFMINIFSCHLRFMFCLVIFSLSNRK